MSFFVFFKIYFHILSHTLSTLLEYIDIIYSVWIVPYKSILMETGKKKNNYRIVVKIFNE